MSYVCHAHLDFFNSKENSDSGPVEFTEDELRKAVKVERSVAILGAVHYVDSDQSRIDAAVFEVQKETG